MNLQGRSELIASAILTDATTGSGINSEAIARITSYQRASSPFLYITHFGKKKGVFIDTCRSIIHPGDAWDTARGGKRWDTARGGRRWDTAGGGRRWDTAGGGRRWLQPADLKIGF